LWPRSWLSQSGVPSADPSSKADLPAFATHYLGEALVAPLCAWLAIAESACLGPPADGRSRALLDGGFDINRACQGYASDCATGVFSLQAKLGIENACGSTR